MIVILDNGKAVRFLNDIFGIGRALTDQGAAAESFHVYNGKGAKYMCSFTTLDSVEREEAEIKFTVRAEKEEANRREMLANLLGSDGDHLVAEMQGERLDSQTAPFNIRRILGLSLNDRSVNWATVKATIISRRRSKEIAEEAQTSGAVPFIPPKKGLPATKYARLWPTEGV